MFNVRRLFTSSHPIFFSLRKCQETSQPCCFKRLTIDVMCSNKTLSASFGALGLMFSSTQYSNIITKISLWKVVEYFLGYYNILGFLAISIIISFIGFSSEYIFFSLTINLRILAVSLSLGFLTASLVLSFLVSLKDETWLGETSELLIMAYDAIISIQFRDDPKLLKMELPRLKRRLEIIQEKVNRIPL